MEAITACSLTDPGTDQLLLGSEWGEGRGQKVGREIVSDSQGNSTVQFGEYSVAWDSLFGLYKRQWFGKDSLWTEQWRGMKSLSRCVYQSQPVFLECEISFLWLIELLVQPKGHSASLWADRALRKMRDLCGKSFSAREGKKTMEGQRDLNSEPNLRPFRLNCPTYPKGCIWGH